MKIPAQKSKISAAMAMIAGMFAGRQARAGGTAVTQARIAWYTPHLSRQRKRRKRERQGCRVR